MHARYRGDDEGEEHEKLRQAAHHPDKNHVSHLEDKIKSLQVQLASKEDELKS